MTTSNADRLIENIEKVLGLIMPRVLEGIAPFAQWEYRVVLVASVGMSGPAPGGGVMVSVAPVDPIRNPFGPLTIQMGKGADGVTSVPVVGSVVVVAFRDGNPAKPAIVACDPSVPTVLPPGTGYVPGTTVPLTVAGALMAFATTPVLTPTNLATSAAALALNLKNLL